MTDDKNTILYQNKEYSIETNKELYNPYNKPLTDIIYELAKELESWKLQATSLSYADTICALEIDLEHKKQEYNELREYHNKCCEEFENKKKELLEKYNQLSRDFYNGKYCNLDKCKQLQIKTQECERLKNEIEFCYSQVADFDIIATSKSNKLKQAEQRLERIIQMLRNGVKIHDDIIVNKSILQIIDEVIPNEN